MGYVHRLPTPKTSSESAQQGPRPPLSTASFPDGEGKQEAVPREARERKTIPSKVTEATFVFIKIVFDS